MKLANKIFIAFVLLLSTEAFADVLFEPSSDASQASKIELDNKTQALEGTLNLQQDWTLTNAVITLKGALKTNGYNITLTNSKLSVTELNSHQNSDLTLTNSTFTAPVSASDQIYRWKNITLNDKSSIQSHISDQVDQGLNWHANQITVDESSGFDVSAKSTYLVGTVNYRTGSHAGLGSYNSNASYGSTTAPYTLGTASRTTADTNIGNGGGALKLTVNQLQLNGYLRANGTSYSRYGAAGGSIWIDANQFSGTGKIQANAGAPSGNAYTGGGGRIAVYANNFTDFNVDNIEATNGLAETDKRAESYVGSVGTIYLKNKSENTSSLLLKNNNVTHSQKQTTVGDIVGIDSVQLINSSASADAAVWRSKKSGDVYLKNSIFTFPVTANEDPFYLQSLTLSDNSSIQSFVGKEQGLGLNLNVDTIIVDESSGFDVSAKSTYLVGTVNYRTGSHAGLGSYNSNASYGSTTAPYTLGTASRTTADTNIGNGGGALKLTVNQLQLNGYLRANGTSYSRYGAAGGSIWIDANQFLGTGKIQANAGAPSGNAYTGGGGRIAVYANNFTDFNVDNIEATNGLAETDKRAESYVGSVGTIYLKNKSENTSSLLLKNNNATHSQKQTDVGDISGHDFIALIKAKAIVSKWESKKSGKIQLEKSILTLPLSQSENPFYLQAITLSDNSSIQSFVGKEQGLGLNLNVDIIIVDETSGFDVSAKSTYLVGTVNYRTGSHAGLGSYNSNASYGSTTAPYTLGTASRTTADTNIGNGGGALKLTVNQLQLNGYLRANGTSYSRYGAAGGSIWVDANQLSGAGKIQANAGAASGNTYTGGGGYVAVYANDLSEFNINQIEATNGLAAGDKRAVGYVGGVGTVHIENKTTGKKTLKLVNKNSVYSSTTATFEGYDYIISSGVNLNLTGNINVDNITRFDGVALKLDGSLTLQQDWALSDANITLKGALKTNGYSIALTNSKLSVTELSSHQDSDLTLTNSTFTAPVSALDHIYHWKNITLNDKSSIQSHISDQVDQGLNWQANQIAVDETSGFDVSAKSTYLVGTSSYRTGSHAGRGAVESNESYGSLTQPYALGAAARYGNDNNLGNGGGALKLTVNQLQLDGYLRANGSYYSRYGAAGGSIWLDVGTLSGAGQIQSNAGTYPTINTSHYTGGGGRIAVYANDLSEFEISRIEATNGLAAGDNRHISYVGGVGTVHIENKTTGEKTLRLVNNGGVLSNQVTRISNLSDYHILLDNAVVGFLDEVALQSNTTINNSRVNFENNFYPNEFNLLITNSELAISGQIRGSGGNIELDKSKLEWPVADLEKPAYWQTIKLQNNSTLTHKEVDSYPLGINIVAHSFEIDENSKVDVSSKGRLGIDKANYAGGSYGALGGNAKSEPYGEDYVPFGGGIGGNPSYKTRGGGSFKLTAASMLINGKILANGMANNYSGGSGGSIWLSAGDLAGSGDINADGASGKNYSYSGGGSGGRVAVYYAQSQGSLINRLSVKGAENAGQAGTVYTNQRQLAVLVSDTSPSNTGYVIESLNSFIVRFYQPIDAQTFTTEDVRINGSVHNNLTISQLSATEFLVTLTEPITKIARHEIIIGPHIASINGALMDQNQNGITAEEADAYRFFIDVKQQQKLVDKNITISGENNILEGMRVIVDDAVVTASGNIQLDSLELINGAKLLVSSGEALQLIVNELKISKNSIVNASSKGSKGTHGLAGQGGSYAGSGGSTVKNPVTANKYTTRGSYSYPEELGEGGLDFLGSPSYSSFGGGAIHIVTKSLVIDGQILSNGDDIDAGTTGAGSGGSILIETESIEGSGRIEARGGHSNFAGSGSGGRVAVLYHENHGYEFSRNINVSGGGKVIYPVINAYGNIGAAGTLYLKDIENDHETLVFMHDYYADSMGGNSVSANADVIQFANAKANLVNVRTPDFVSKSSFLENNEKSFIAIDTYALDLTVIQSSKAWDIANGIMQINKGNTLLLKGKTQWNSLIIDEGAILSVPEYQENDEVPYVIAQEIEIKKGAKADLSFKGKLGDISKKRLAGSLGGYGAYLPTSYKNPLPVIGSFYSPYEWGVGGSGTTARAYRGGGSLRMSAETFRLDGTITSQGADLSSGGSLWINTDLIEGKGSIAANGGAGGGGGRVALYYGTSDFSLANISANKGNDVCTTETYYCLTGLVAHTNGTVYIADNSIAPQVVAPTFKAMQPANELTIVFSNYISAETVTSDAFLLQCNNQWLTVGDITELSPNEFRLSFIETLPLGKCVLTIAPSILNQSGLALEEEYVHSFVVDDTRPQTLIITSDTLTEVNYRRSKNFTITGEKEPGNDVFVDGQLADSLSETEWSINLYREHGIYSLEIYQQDLAGNRSDNLYLDMQIDIVVPKIQFSLGNYIKTNKGEFTFRYLDIDSQIDEDSLVYSLSLNGEEIQVNHEPLAEASGYAGILLKSEQLLDDGLYKIKITIADKAGNKSGIDREFTVDTVAPQNFSLTQDYFEAVTQQIKISGTVELDSYLYITVKGSSTNTYSSGWLNNTNWSLNVNLWEGENTITVVAQDRAGNQTLPLIAKAIYDNSPPGEVTPIIDAKGNGKEVNLDWSHYLEKDNGGDISYYRIYQSESAFTSVNDASVKMISRRHYSYKSFNVTALERNKDYYFAVVAEDNFGLYLTSVTPIKVTPEDIVAPEKPKVQVIKSQSNSITLRVTPPEEEDLLGVTVTLGDKTATVSEYPQGFVDVIFSDLQQSESYPVSAISFDAANNESGPQQLTAFTLLASPNIISAEIREGKAYLVWQESMPEFNAGQIRIFIESERFISVEGLSPRMTLPTGNLQTVVSGLSGNTTYYIALVAVNTHGAFNPVVNVVEIATEKDIEGPEISSITYNGQNIGYGMELTESGIVTAVLYDKSGIGRIDLSIDGIVLDSRYGANGSYQYALNLENISDGLHTFKVVAKDTLENETVLEAQVVVNLKAPEAPTLLGSNKSTGEVSYHISGKTDTKALISLYNNEQLIIDNLQSNNGVFTYSLSLSEGPNNITAYARYPERTKKSVVSNNIVITLDSSVPKAPAMLNAQTLDSGRVILTWPAVTTEDVVGYQLYRSTEPIISVEHAEALFNKPKNITKHEDLPTIDGHYYYAVAALNGLGTSSDLAHANAISDRQGPIIKIGYETNGAFDNTTKTYGRGVLTIQLTTDEELRTMPYLSLTAEGGVPRNIALQASLGIENTYEGTLELTDKLMSGIYWAVVGAYDQYGNRTGEVTSGVSIKIDTQGPFVTSLNTIPEAPIQNNAEGQEISIMFALDEEHAEAELPLLIPGILSTYGEFTVLSGFEHGFSANKEANHWVAGMTLPVELAAEETQTLYFKVITQDKLGNKREAWIEKSGVEVYQGELPALRAPNGLVANAMAAGKVQLSWNEVSNASAYRIYRAVTGTDGYSVIKEQALFEYIDGIDSLLNDGNYQYYVTSVRSDNNQQSESSPSNVVQVTTDSISPATPLAVKVDLASNGVHVVWEKINEEVTYNLYRSATSLEGQVAVEQAVLVGSRIAQSNTMDTSPNSDEPYYYVTAVDKAGNESGLSEAAYLNANLLPVSKLQAVKSAEGAISLSWQHKGQSGLKYQITRTINGVAEVLGSTENLNYQDTVESQYPLDITYTVTAIDRNNVSSLEHPITIPAISIKALENIVLQRGVMNKVLFRVDSLDSSLLRQAQLKVGVELNDETKTHLSERFSAESGAYATVPVVIAGYSDLEDYENLSLTLESEPQAGDSLRIHAKLPALATDNGLLIELTTEQAVKGASAILKATITNPGSAPVEVVTAESRGAKPSSSLWVYLETEEGEVIAKMPVNIGTGKVVNLSSGHTVFRAEAGERAEMPPINVDIPSNAPDKVVIRLQANTIHYHLGYADHAEMRGSTATVKVNTEATPYRAEITSVSATHISAGDKFSIEGQIIANRNNEPLNNRDVKIIISINGFDKMRTIKTDSAGQFSYEHQTDDDVSGEYLISVVHPLVSEKPIMARVSTERLAVTPTRMNVKVPYNYIATPSFKLTASELFNDRQLIVEVSDETPLPEGLTIKLPESLSISSGKSLMLPVELSATEQAPSVGTLLLELKDTEGQFYSYIRIEYQFSKVAGAITFSKNYIETGLALGSSVQESIQLKNTGFTDLRDIQLSVEPLEGYSLPNWVAIAQQNIALLPIGGSTQTDIMITPDSGVSEGVHAFKLQATSAANGLVQSIPVYINVTQSGVGNAFFHVVDFYTGTLDKNNAIIPGLVGAKITLQNELVLSEEYELKTDQFGDAFFESIPAGRYYYRISAFDHSSSSGRVWIKPGTTSSERVLLQNTLVSVEFSVKEITLQDKYDILLEARYETNVPAPVVVMNPLSINLPNMKRGEVFQGEFTLTNHGLIEAQEVRAMLPTGDQYAQFEFLRRVPNVLSAGEVFVMPYRVIALKNFDNSEDNMSGIASLLGRELATAGCYSHQYNNRVDYKFECAAGDEGTGSITQVYHSSGGSCGGGVGGGGGGSYGGGYGGGGNGGGSYSTSKPQELGYWMCVQAEDNDDDPDTDC